jgi:hypothetical protein
VCVCAISAKVVRIWKARASAWWIIRYKDLCQRKLNMTHGCFSKILKLRPPPSSVNNP